MKIVLLEFIDEAKILLRKYGKDFLNKNTVVIALHPKVRVFLEQKGIRSKDTIDYLDNDSQHRIILESERLTTMISERINLFDAFNINKGYKETFIHHLRLYLNYFFWIIEIISNIRDKHKINGIYCCLPKDQEAMYSDKPYLQDQERFLGYLAKDFCKVNNISFCGTAKRVSKSNPLLKLVTAFVRKIAEATAILNYKILIAKKDLRKTIVVPALSYRMDKLLAELKQKNPNTRYFMVWEGKGTFKQEVYKICLVLSNHIKRIKGKNIVEGVISLDSIRNIFKKDAKQQNNIRKEFERLNTMLLLELKDSLVYNKVSFLPYLIGKASKGLKQEMLSLQHTTMVLEKVFQAIKPNLLMSMYSGGITYMMGELSQYMGFSSLDITHGTHVPPNNQFEKIENYRLATSVILNTYKNVAVQTPWADKFLDYYKDTRPRLFSGPLIYSVINNGICREKEKEIYGIPNNMKVVIHAATQKPRKGLRFHITETMDEYISTLSDIVRAVDKLDGVFFIIRPHPVCDISQEEFKALLPSSDKFAILSKGSFTKVLSIADILISYSSTCIEEALQSKIPVILFDKWKRYNHFNIKETKGKQAIDNNPVYYLSDSRILSDIIAKVLDEPKENLFRPDILADYKYPEKYKSNFFNFVEEVLKM